MPEGAGKYDEIATVARQSAGPESSVVLVVLNGTLGSGFSVQARNPMLLYELGELLRHLAEQIDKELAQKPKPN